LAISNYYFKWFTKAIIKKKLINLNLSLSKYFKEFIINNLMVIYTDEILDYYFGDFTFFSTHNFKILMITNIHY
jgi:hypothetical protein